MSRIPDEWTWGAQFSPGVAPRLDLPAIPGVAHVVTAVAVRYLVSGGAAATGIGNDSVIQQGGQDIVVLFMSTTGSGANGSFDDCSWEGAISGGPGNAIAVVCPANPAVTYSFLRVKGTLL